MSPELPESRSSGTESVVVESQGAGLSPEQLSSFRRDGFVAIQRLLTDAELAPITAEYDALLEAHVDHLLGVGRLDDRLAGDFSDRFSAMLAIDPEFHRRCNISYPLINGPVDPEGFDMHCGPAVFDLLRNEKILDLVESLIGPEISSNPVQQMRMKPPAACVSDPALQVHSNVGRTTWHQDIVALLPDADETTIVTVWVALTDAFVENGCLVSIPGSHQLGPQVHCANAQLASEPNVPEAVLAGMEERPLPVSRGGVVLFDKLNAHCSLPNHSSKMRWSADLRYNVTGQGTGRPAFPGFVARSVAEPESVLADYGLWRQRWTDAKARIIAGEHGGRMFEDTRWNDPAVC